MSGVAFKPHSLTHFSVFVVFLSADHVICSVSSVWAYYFVFLVVLKSYCPGILCTHQWVVGYLRAGTGPISL